MALERRYAEVQFDAGAEGRAPRFYGVAIKYNSRTAIGNPKTWGFYEEIAPGAVRNLADFDIAMLCNHDDAQVVSRISAGTLRLADSQVGLNVESDLDDDLSYVRDLKANLRNRNVQGMSFGFNVIEQEWKENLEDETEVRIITSLDLIEVSAVTFPAYTDTEADMRNAPALVERRSAWEAERQKASLVTSPETDRQAAFLRRERNLRYLAARYGLSYERTDSDA